MKYADAGVPVAVKLEAFSPFIPLNTDDSSLPATVLQFTLRNTSAAAVEATLDRRIGKRRLSAHRDRSGRFAQSDRPRAKVLTTLLCSAEKLGSNTGQPARPDIVFEDWNRETYDGWKVEGTAFGSGPVKKSEMPSYQGDVGGDTARVVNSHASAPGDSIEARRTAPPANSPAASLSSNEISSRSGLAAARRGRIRASG